MESSGHGFIYAFWHGRQAFLVYLHQGDQLRQLVSKSKDGELIARICHSFGIATIRGSSSRRGAGALLELVSEVERGGWVAVTPDGPKGPLRKVQNGVLVLAQKTGAPIVPVAYGARRTWIFKSWDEFIVPKPFNRISMVYGAPLYIGAQDDLGKKARVLEDALNRVMQEADQLAGARS
jgi:lysophospholipid acyltransferase (LPLAT)-like uncharacterized protein